MNEPSRITIANSSSIIGFEKSGGGGWPIWDRYLTIENKRAYHIGNVCGTCAFFFERLEGESCSISAAAIAERLNNGTNIADPAFTSILGQILPTGVYYINFSTVLPRLIEPGDRYDYFVQEQVALWGIDASPPHHPRVSYYRSHSPALGKHRQLFEFVIPMFPTTKLDQQRVIHYQDEIAHGRQPTAFTISVLDIKQPAVWEGNPEITEHWCLAHYLLDGHHKIYAASQTKEPLNLVSFLTVDASLASEEEIKVALACLTSG
ncbi:hypothetical protein I8751_14980 [Nostocaceae cyanobacterium CENA357]|uniref:Uncharacterized protein n=1 Tax=Atlanticothrix silvestris CENA357 TaxID=1725252 RepID=A0A8J7HEQ2_9CYAN|nr:hypothetical protein [Atlanticothrix silvestris]MBH8553651.1 hypothetical protein [Atlanticothrix silvestris CENA357]